MHLFQIITFLFSLLLKLRASFPVCDYYFLGPVVDSCLKDSALTSVARVFVLRVIGAMSTANSSVEDVEKGAAATDYAHLMNSTVHSFSWQDVTVTVKDRKTKEPLEILSGVNGIVEAGALCPLWLYAIADKFPGEMLALMGPRYAVYYTL